MGSSICLRTNKTTARTDIHVADAPKKDCSHYVADFFTSSPLILPSRQPKSWLADPPKRVRSVQSDLFLSREVTDSNESGRGDRHQLFGVERSTLQVSSKKRTGQHDGAHQIDGYTLLGHRDKEGSWARRTSSDIGLVSLASRLQSIFRRE